LNKYKTSNLFNQRLRSSQPYVYKNLLSFQYSVCTEQQYLYLMVGKKYGNAVSRNRLKRRLRVAYGNMLKTQPCLGLMAKPIQKNINFKDIKQASKHLLSIIQEQSK
jgi:ribonuclease P protein component